MILMHDNFSEHNKKTLTISDQNQQLKLNYTIKGKNDIENLVRIVISDTSSTNIRLNIIKLLI